VRKMFEEVGHHVEKIRRVQYGPLALDVPPGDWRNLTLLEVAKLKSAATGPKLTLPPSLPSAAHSSKPLQGKAFSASRPMSASKFSRAARTIARPHGKVKRAVKFGAPKHKRSGVPPARGSA